MCCRWFALASKILKRFCTEGAPSAALAAMASTEANLGLPVRAHKEKCRGDY